MEVIVAINEFAARGPFRNPAERQTVGERRPMETYWQILSTGLSS
jgi:hypothetical protein